MKKIIAFFCMVTIISLTSCSLSQQKPYTSEVFVMSTYVTQQIYGKNGETALNNVKKLLNDLEKELSLFIENSDIDKINKNAGIKAVNVNDYTFNLVKTAKKYSELSNGKFDITIAPLTLLWGIDTENAHVPMQTEINEALKLIDYKNIILNEKDKSIMLAEEGMSLDLGGVAKGYIVDLIKKEYENQNIKSALVSIGGNVFAYGTKPDKSLFKLGVRDPNGVTGNEIMGKLKVKDKVVATTGGYERYFEQDGKIYHHILDVETGYPVKSDIVSVTVISDDGGLADFLSTSIFIEGKENINNFINDERFEVIIIDNTNKVYVSPSLMDDFEISNKDYSLE